jgi:hypothetical protein
MRIYKALVGSLLFAIATSCWAQQAVTTESYDNSRTASNLTETILNQADVNQAQFGKLYAITMDGSIYAQPLYVPNLSINGISHNALYVETMNNVVYCLDADSGVQLWVRDYRVAGAVPVPSWDGNVLGNFGIMGTPVIDLTAGPNGTMFFVSYMHQSGGNPYYILHGIDITTGNELLTSPVIAASATGTNAGVVFNAALQMQRPGLAIANGQIIVAFGSFGDVTPYSGFVFSFAESTLQQASFFVTSSNGEDSGIWQSGRSPVIDSSGNIFYQTGNGTYDGGPDWGDTFLKLSGSLTVSDWFAPANFQALDQGDTDLGSSGPLMIPNTNLLVGAGKQGLLYVLNSTNLGHELNADAGAIQEFQLGGSIFSGMAFYNRASNPELFVWPAGVNYLSGYSFNGATFTLPPMQSTLLGTTTFGAGLAVSANGSIAGTGIVWANRPISPASLDEPVIGAELDAFNADTLALLWTSNQNSSRDSLPDWQKFRSPLVANGKVYIGSVTATSYATTATLNVFGILPPAPPPPPTPQPLKVPNMTLPIGYIGVPYSVQLLATGGNGTYNWVVDGGSMAPGLSVSTNGILSGTPTSNFWNNFSVKVFSAGMQAQPSSSYSVQIQNPPVGTPPPPPPPPQPPTGGTGSGTTPAATVTICAGTNCIQVQNGSTVIVKSP